MRKNDSFSEAEFRMLLSGESGKDEPLELFDLDDRKLLQALVRNQLRQLHLIEELQAEIRMLRSALEARDSAAYRESAAALDPLPFMRPGRPAQEGAAELQDAQEQETLLTATSRKERFKRRSLWRKK